MLLQRRQLKMKQPRL
jgi:hypothetical protein